VPILANTFLTFDAKGIREQLSNIISRISPEDTPLQGNVDSEPVSGSLFEWQMDALRAAAANARLQGNDSTFTARTPTTRVGNFTQISGDEFLISGTLEAVDKAGRRSEEAYQLTKAGVQIKRDIEFIIHSNVGGVGGSSVVAPLTATLGAWVKTNTDFGAGGANPVWASGVPGAGRTDGTQRAFTETILKNVAQKGYVSGAKFKYISVGPLNKQVVSGFAGIATKTFFQEARKATAIIGAADIYVTDYGTLAIVPNIFQRERDAWFMDPSMIRIGVLRPYMKEQLAKTGDATKYLMLKEWGLKVMNEAGLGLAADLS
jgi:hypothetical protein